MLTEQRAVQEALDEKRLLNLAKIVDYRLSGMLRITGAVLTGYSMKIEDEEATLSLRIELDGLHFVAFLTGATPSSCFLKASLAAARGKLRLKADKYKPPQI